MPSVQKGVTKECQMKFIQLNLNHCRAAQDLLSQSLLQSNVDVAIVFEQYKDLYSGIWIADKNSKAAIWICGSRATEEIYKDPENKFTYANIEGIYTYL